MPVAFRLSDFTFLLCHESGCPALPQHQTADKSNTGFCAIFGDLGAFLWFDPYNRLWFVWSLFTFHFYPL
jgi:hypothetical protein